MTSQLVTGKLAFVTGAGSGIGRAVCKVLAREGAKVIASDAKGTTANETVQQLPGGAGGAGGHLALEADVSQRSSVFAALQRALESFQQPPTIVVNCAGITRDNFLLKMDERSFDDVIAVNLKGTYLVVQATAQAMLEAGVGDGSIINVSSIVGHHGNIGQANYSASKAAVEALTKTAAKEFGKFNIRVNAVVPGFIVSPMTDAIPDKVKQLVLPRIAAGRFGRPEEVAEVVTFLASDRSSYVNGTCVEVTGG